MILSEEKHLRNVNQNKKLQTFCNNYLSSQNIYFMGKEECSQQIENSTNSQLRQTFSEFIVADKNRCVIKGMPIHTVHLAITINNS